MSDSLLFSRSLVVAMPAFNEGDGIAEFLSGIDDALSSWPGSAAIIVVDDRSTDDTSEVIKRVQKELSRPITLLRNEINVGHGPSTVRALTEGVRSGADFIVQVDGDGQFFPHEILLLARGLEQGADVVIGVRRGRRDPWFRRALSRVLRTYMRLVMRTTSSDPNCPFRAYRREVLSDLVESLPEDPLVPTVYLTALADSSDFTVTEVAVQNRERLGGKAQGTMWGKRSHRILIPSQLMRFVWRAFVESLIFARSR